MAETSSVLTRDNTARLTEIVEKHKGKEGGLMGVLHETQELLGYIPYEAQKFIAEGLDVPLSEVYGVVTFYSAFTLEPVGKNRVSVCLGTACYVKGAEQILNKACETLGLRDGETSADGNFSITSTRCIGACGLAPVMIVNDDVYGKLKADEVPDILAKYM